MAVDSPIKLKFSVSSATDCKSIRFTDETGRYTSSNVSGYGTPNPELSDFTSATVEVTAPDGNNYTVNVFPTLPANDCTFYKIYNTDLGLGSTDSIPDGLYYFNYTIEGPTYIETATRYVMLDCNVECCVNKLAAKVETCGCDSKSLQAFSDAWDMLMAMRNAMACGKTSQASEILTYLQGICNKTGCGCS